MVLYAGNFELGEVDVRLSIFHGDLSRLDFVLEFVAIRLLQGNTRTAYGFSDCKEMINHLFFMD